MKNQCQWAVNGVCENEASTIIERRKEKPSDPDYNIGKLKVCWKHLDEASRFYPYIVGPVKDSEKPSE